MGRDSGLGFLVMAGICSFITLGCSITIICLVKYNLWNYLWACDPYYTWWWYTNCVAVDLTCLIGSSVTDATMCQYAVAIGAVGIFFSLIQMCTMAAGGMGAAIGELILAVLGMGWWIPAAIIMTINSGYSNDKNWPQKSYRSGVEAVCWIAAGFYIITFVASIVSCMKARRGERRDDRAENDKPAQPMSSV